FFYLIFFFQAEDGIRDKLVTGVQTCALPISVATMNTSSPAIRMGETGRDSASMNAINVPKASVLRMALVASKAWLAHGDSGRDRSEERRVGKEGKSRWSPQSEKNKTKLIKRE